MAGNQQYVQIARATAAKYGLDPEVFVRQIRRESGFQAHIGSPAGAQGIAQIMPGTARSWGVDPNNPVQALDAAARHMAGYVHSYKGDYAKALAAYNAGPGAVAKYGGVPPFAETQHYVKAILAGSHPGGGNPAPAAPNAADGSYGAPVGLSAKQQAAVSMILGRSNPQVAQILAARQQQLEAQAASSPTAGQQPLQPSSTQAAAHAVGNAHGWQDLQRVAQTRFGLRNDPGDSQTIGGHHTAGSEHYKGRAIDFGNARNSQAALNAWKKWALANGYDAIDEGTHIHVSLPGGGI